MSDGTILDRILATKRDEVAQLLQSNPSPEQIVQTRWLPPTRGFHDALRARNVAGSIALIAEVKKASPSKGVIREDFDPIALARAYADGGSACLSVLTDRIYFQGDLSYLSQIRAAVSLPLLRKDFVIHEQQIWEARLAGADAILLIVAALPDIETLRTMRALAESLRMDALVEVHDAPEMDIALSSGATLLGINNRNLHTFDVRLETTLDLLPYIPADITVVSESGIYTNGDAWRLRDAGAHALLVGESLMRAGDVARATRRLLNGDELELASG